MYVHFKKFTVRRELPGEKGTSWWEESFPVGKGFLVRESFLVGRELSGGKRTL